MKRLLVITGPTASGKTDLAMALAKELGGSVVSADSRQVYAGMNVGTAKPRFAWSDVVHDPLVTEPAGPVAPAPPPGGAVAPAGGGPPSHHPRLSNIPHYLLNVRRPDQPLSLSDWQTMAFSAIDRVLEQNGTPLLVGGTMLYIDSILKNYALPQVAPNPTLRAELEQRKSEDLYTELLAQDPAARKFIEPSNKRRIIRALEVIAATHKPFSEQRQQRPPRYSTTAIGLFDTWEALAERIKQRAAAMLEEGLLEETQKITDTYGADLPLLQTMNYREALAHLQGTLSAERMLEEIGRANMRYARRQMSWWRERPDIAWYSPADVEGIKKRLLIS